MLLEQVGPDFERQLLCKLVTTISEQLPILILSLVDFATGSGRKSKTALKSRKALTIRAYFQIRLVAVKFTGGAYDPATADSEKSIPICSGNIKGISNNLPNSFTWWKAGSNTYSLTSMLRSSGTRFRSRL